MARNDSVASLDLLTAKSSSNSTLIDDTGIISPSQTSDSEILKTYLEPLVLGKLESGRTHYRLQFAKENIVSEIVSQNEQGYMKQTQRTVPNNLRRHMPIKYICENGGWIKNSRANVFRYVKAGTKPPDSLANEPIFSLNKDANHKHCELKLQVPDSCQSSTDAAHMLANQLAEAVQSYYPTKYQ